jgi:hypothetical protein
MNNYARFVATAVTLVAATASVSAAEEHKALDAVHAYNEYGRHHISSFAGWTNVDGSNYATGSIEYEYRLNSIFGVGAIAEHAGGAFDADSYMAALDVHPFETGLLFQFAIGKEFRTVYESAEEGHGHEAGEGNSESIKVNERVTVGRAGMLYEFEFGRFTLAPQVHWDYHHREPNSIVFGLSAGVNF